MSAKYQRKLSTDEQPAKRPRTCKFLNESLLEFPDPSSLNRSGDNSGAGKLMDTISCLNERHKEQRRRLLERQEQEYRAWENDVDKQLDHANKNFNHAFSLRNPTVGIPSEAWQLMNSEVAKQALQRLPASKRKTLVCSDQAKEQIPGLSAESNRDQLTAVELAAILAEHGTRIRRKMVNEEQELRLSQLEGTHLFHRALERTNVRFKNPQPRPVPQGANPELKQPIQASFKSSNVPAAMKSRSREQNTAFNSSSASHAAAPKVVAAHLMGGHVSQTSKKREEPPRDPRLKSVEQKIQDDNPRDTRLNRG